MYFRNIRKLSLGQPGKHDEQMRKRVGRTGKRVGQLWKLQLGGVQRNGQLWKLQLGGVRRNGQMRKLLPDARKRNGPKRWKLKSPACGDKVPNGVSESGFLALSSVFMVTSC